MDLTQNELDHLRTAMNAELDRLIAARKPEVKQWPQIGDLVHSITCGNDGICVYSHHMTQNDFYWHEVGAIFKTRAEAERRVEALKVQAELRRMPGVITPPKYWVHETFYCIAPHAAKKYVVTTSRGARSLMLAIAGVWFEGPAYAENAIYVIGQERLQIWLDDYLQTPIGCE